VKEKKCQITKRDYECDEKKENTREAKYYPEKWKLIN